MSRELGAIGLVGVADEGVQQATGQALHACFSRLESTAIDRRALAGWQQPARALPRKRKVGGA